MAKEINETFRYVVNPFRFKGAVITSMSDGIHSDYDKGETLDMLRERFKISWLVTVTSEEIQVMIDKYETSLQTPFEEITEYKYLACWAAFLPKDSATAVSLLVKPITEAFTDSASNLTESITLH